MKYFELYEKIRDAKNSIKLESKWVVVKVTRYPYVSNRSILGEIITVISVDSEFVIYYYDRLARDGFIPSIRPIKMFLESFRPVIE